MSPTAPVKTTYQYTPLDRSRREIRLVTILPGRDFAADVVVSLEVVQLRTFPYPQYDSNRVMIPLPPRPESPVTTDSEDEDEGESGAVHGTAEMSVSSSFIDYECLSYAWGSEEDPFPVHVTSTSSAQDIDRVIAATQNLGQALRHLRRRRRARRFFIDALCIDQGNIAERGQQVALMGDIYRRAAQTTVWLGPEADDSATALDIFEDMHGRCKLDRDANVVIEGHEAAHGLRRYWRRNLQPQDREAMAVFHLIGRPWFSRLWVRQEVALSRDLVVVCGRDRCSWDALVDSALLMWQAGFMNDGAAIDVESVRRKTVLYRLCRVRSWGVSMTTLRWSTRGLGFKDARDGVYGMLELLQTDGELAGLKPDYAKSASQVYQEVVLLKAIGNRDLSVLEGCELASVSLAGLPTWAPDLSSPQLIACNLRSHWSACGWLSAHAETHEPGTLRVAAVKVCVVARTIPLREAGADREEPHDHWVGAALRRTMADHQEDDEYVGGGTVAEAVAGLVGPFVDEYEVPQSNAPTMATMRRVLRDNPQDEPGRLVMTGHAQAFEARCTFWTVGGYVGTGPAEARPGDAVCVILGYDKPMLLRPVSSSSSSSSSSLRYQVVGPLVVPGLMVGEAITGPLGGEWFGYHSRSATELGIKRFPVCLRNRDTGTILTSPAEVLEMKGIAVNEYRAYPHLLDVDLEVLRAKGVKLEHIDLI